MSHRRITSRLLEIGRFEDCRLGEYEPGQFFVHRVFGYRGVILFPWAAKMVDFDAANERKQQRKTSSKGGNGNDVVVKPNYQVLMDQRDYPNVRAMKDDLVIFHKDPNSGKKYLSTLLGFSHVSHEDVLPYSSTESQCLKHDSFAVCFEGRLRKTWHLTQLPALRSWRDHCIPFLELSSVYRQTTQDVRVTAIPYYLGNYKNSKKNEETYLWRYSIRVENLGGDSLTLRSIKWQVRDGSGRHDPAEDALSVVGSQPRLPSSKGALQYSSFVVLSSGRGHMSGKYVMQRDDGTSFLCHVPRFTLESRQTDGDILS